MVAKKRTRLEEALTAGRRTRHLPNTNAMSVAKAVAKKLLAPPPKPKSGTKKGHPVGAKRRRPVSRSR